MNIRRYLSSISATLIVLAVGAIEYTGTRYRIDEIARKYQYTWPKLLEEIDLVTAPLGDREETVTVFFKDIDISLSDGRLYGIANAKIRPQDEYYAITQNPLLVLGKLTFPRLEADYAYETFMNSGRINVTIMEVTVEVKMYVRPESETESVDPISKMISYGDVEITFSGSIFDKIMAKFEDRVRVKLPEILQDAMHKITQEIKKRVNRDLPTLAKIVTSVVGEEIHGKTKNEA
ncbi:hypothetical protein QAD02_006512 [Eretmocerus hayati]|uniref:Uncharacterized protein n=1 Tax=Eretmocerus hayati TaxID=131215 RepID=A0ACC2N135_9HYME|nr:hypothetical protein QAD02_006512 [Eretmocerus hayati]